MRIKSSKPPVNIIEFPDYYQVELPAPGFQKNDFLVKTNGCSLLIIACKKNSDLHKEGRFHQHDFYCRYITRNIDLPGDADTEFGTAAYKNGVLYIYLYKTTCPVQNHQNFIMVY